jgi:hypothetical protein
MVARAPARTTERPWVLVRRTVGDLDTFGGKAARLAYAVRHYVIPGEARRRLERLHALGHVEEIPTRIQRFVGAVDMFRFFIVPAANDYYRRRGFSFWFHQLLRFLDDPASMIDPTGLRAHRDAIIGHVMQVVHANPVYDLQLLEAIPGGIDELERQVAAMVAGTHPRGESILAVCEDPDYHFRLLDYVRRWRRDPDGPPPMVRENIPGNPALALAERTFGTMPAAMRYFRRMPSTPWGAARHLLTVRALG